MNTPPTEILLVEADSTTAMAIQQALSQTGYLVTYAANPGMALEASKGRNTKVAILSSSTQGDPNTDALTKQLADAEIPVIVLASGIEDAKPMLRLKPVGGLVKPLREGEIEMILSLAEGILAERTALKREIENLTAVVNGMLDSVFIVNAERKIIFANATASRTTHCDTLRNRDLAEFFATDDQGNAELSATLNSALSGSNAIGSGSRATLRTPDGNRSQVVVIVSVVKEASGAITGASMSFRPAPASASAPPAEEPKIVEQDSAANQEQATGLPDTLGQHTPLRAKAIKSIELRLTSESTTLKHYVVVLLLSQFDMFRMRYGLNNAEKLVHAFSAHLIKSLPTEDRLYAWSNRTVVVLLERESTADEVRLEMTSFCSRRVDYYLNAAGRSALVTLSASWTLIPLFDCPEAKKDPKKIVDQIDAFERLYTRRK